MAVIYCPHCRPFQVLETLDECDSEDLANAPSQPDTEELRRLLSTPHIRALVQAHDVVAHEVYSPEARQRSLSPQSYSALNRVHEPPLNGLDANTGHVHSSPDGASVSLSGRLTGRDSVTPSGYSVPPTNYGASHQSIPLSTSGLLAATAALQTSNAVHAGHNHHHAQNNHQRVVGQKSQEAMAMEREDTHRNLEARTPGATLPKIRQVNIHKNANERLVSNFKKNIIGPWIFWRNGASSMSQVAHIIIIFGGRCAPFDETIWVNSAAHVPVLNDFIGR